MNTETVRLLFELFAGDDIPEASSQLITLSVSEISEMLLPDADIEDIRLCFLAAALANFRLQQAKSARDNSAVTYAGKMQCSAGTSCENAAKLLKSYMQLCEGLIKPSVFVFGGFSCSGEVLR